MKKKFSADIFLLNLFFGIALSCNLPVENNQFSGDTFSANQKSYISQTQSIVCGAERLAYYIPKLKGKRVGLVANQSSRVQDKHLLDSLLELDVAVKKIFTPEHGFRGEADAGDKIDDQIDDKTGLPLISLYGKKRRPQQSDLENLDILVFDIQDVGVRFYTYISTLHHVMDACAEYDLKLLVLDRPNPNGHYVDGPMRMDGYESFVGMHPVPVVYGMTIGEYAQMINGEGWLPDGRKCDLEVIELNNYDHDDVYRLPVKPSPNLPNLRSIYLYPSLCLFEPTILSIGRGTDKQFQIIGHPDWKSYDYRFTPVPKPGAMRPKLQDLECQGLDLTNLKESEIKEWEGIRLDYLVRAYADLKGQGEFFTSTSFFDKLAGSDQLRNQIINGASADEIRASWQQGLEAFGLIRAKYLLYD